MRTSLADLQSVLGVHSAMITPAVLILSCGSLILTTSTRLTRVVDRVREMLAEVEGLRSASDEVSNEKRLMYLAQLDRAAKRARLLQRTLARLYIALATFVATSVAIGIVALHGLMTFAWVTLVFGFIGAGLLFSASVLLIFESRLALATTYEEMDFTRKMVQRHR
jgi:alkylation response protein AidB-like acyl-CoA dehydrogenase